MNTYSKEVKVANPLGIHARPGSLIVRRAEELKTNGVFIEKDGMTADPKSIISVMILAATQGDVLRVYTNRDDMHKAVDDLAELIGSDFGEIYK